MDNHFRSLENYQGMHKKNHPKVTSARTLTEARIICFGKKEKRMGAAGCRCGQPKCHRVLTNSGSSCTPPGGMVAKT